MDTLAEKCIKCHKKPLVKLDIQGPKILVPTNSPAEVDRVNKSLELLKEGLEVIRVDRRCGRSKCVWLPEENLAQVVKIVGALSHFGYRNKHGYFLPPNEALYLLEMNRIELLCNDVPMSLEQAYSVMLRNDNDLEKYRVYRKLVHCGFQLHQAGSKRKRKLAHEIDDVEPKIQRISDEDAFLQASTSTASENSEKITSVSTTPDFAVHLSSNKTSKAEFNLHINKSSAIDECLKIPEESPPNITAFAFPDSVVFYRFSKVSLPVL